MSTKDRKEILKVLKKQSRKRKEREQSNNSKEWFDKLLALEACLVL